MSFNIKFLTKELVAGLEFMKFQNNSFFNELSGYLENHIDSSGRIDDIDAKFNEIIERHTGFANIKVNLESYGNLAIDAGYISPGNLFNVDGIEQYYPRSESSLYRWFKDNKTQFFLGEIDYATGKVSGAYSQIPFKMYINYQTSEYIDESFLKKYGHSLHEALAAFIVHELGHGFGGVMMIHQKVSDNFHVRTALHFLANAEYVKDRVAIIKDFTQLTDTELKDVKDLDRLVTDNDPNTYVVYLSKLTSMRDVNNSAGLGVRQMNSEVIADAYSIRMGCDKAMIAGLSSMHKLFERQNCFLTLAVTGLLAIKLIASGAAVAPALLIAGGFFAFFGAVHSIGKTLPDIYNAPYRRAMNILQEQIQRIKQNKHYTNEEKSKLLADVNANLQIAEEMKPFFEGTGVQRFFGWMTTAGKFKYVDLEYYTQNINSHSVSLLGNEFRNLKGA